jgi:hypothetical protein
MGRAQSSVAGSVAKPRPGGTPRARPAIRARDVESLSLFVPLFIVALALPIEINIGPLRLWPYRVLLLLAFFPCLSAWLSGRAGKFRWPDLLVLFSTIWSVLALAVHHGAAAWETSGIQILETFGSFLLARTMIRSPGGFERMVRVLFWVIAFLLPFAVVEAVTARPVLLDLLGTVFTVFSNTPHEIRLGLDRVQGTFQHPILFGVFCASAFSLAFYVLGFGKTGIKRWFRPFLVFVGVFLSLSSGPLSALMAQWCVIAYDRLTRTLRNRWLVLAVAIAVLYVSVDLYANRSPVEVFIGYAALNPNTAWARIHIFNYGSAEVMRHPLLGIGHNSNWTRAWWMHASMDMFWLLVAVRYGLPGALSLGLAVIVAAISIGRRQGLNERIAAYRTGFLVMLVGMTIAGWGVHLWNAPYALFMFLLGSGIWILDSNNALATLPSSTDPANGTRRSGPVVKKRGRRH